MIAALFVQTAGAYFGLPNVDPWNEERDARKYKGPHPVVAHPPCSRWCKPLAKVNQTRYGHKIGDDGGCFSSALASVFLYGGVLEHPANSYAWDRFALLKPTRGHWGQTEHLDGYWVTEVSQSAYGHKARKRTWLLYRGHREPPLIVARPDWRIEIDQGKTGKKLAIMISPAVETVLKRAKLMEPQWPREFVIRTKFGKAYTPDGFRALWQRTIREYEKLTGVKTDRPHFHDIRAKSISDNENLNDAYMLAGHIDIAMTRKTYDRNRRRVQPLR